MKENRLTEGQPWKVILIFALPLMGANILQQLYNTVDTVVVGKYDSQAALSAVGSCSYLVMFYLAIAMGFSLGAGVLTSQAFGGKREKEMKAYAGSGIILLVFIGVLMTVFALLTNDLWLKYLIQVPDSLYNAAYQYITLYCVGLIFQFGYNIAAAILRAVGDSRSSLYFLLVTSVLNIVLDLLFVRAFHWSVMGVALATTISQCVSMLVAFAYLFIKYPMFRISRKYWRWDWQHICDILRTGAPMVIQQMVISCGFMLLQSRVNSFGEDMTASFTVACRLECYMVVPISGLSNAVSTFAGQNFGAGEYRRIRQGARHTVILSLFMGILICCCCYAETERLIGIFGITGRAAELCTAHVHLICLGLLLYAAYQPFNGLFQGIGKGKISMCMYMVEYCGRLFSPIFSSVHCQKPVSGGMSCLLI